MSSSRVPRLLLYSWYVDALFQSLKDVRTESQMFRCGGTEIEEEIPVRVSSSISETFLHNFDLSRKHLLRQMYHLRPVPGVLKKYHVVGVERMVRNCLESKKRFCTMKITDMFLWCDPLVNALVRRLSLEHSSIRSSMITKLFTLGSTRAFKSGGKPSTMRMFGIEAFNSW